MNWVGGSRKRITLTKERRKQKDFFEKEKLKSKMKQLHISPRRNSAISLDLLNLHVVNQISTKKNIPDKVQKPVHVDINRGVKHAIGCRNIELPKSPERRPSQPFLDDIQSRIQQEVLKHRRKYLLEKQSLIQSQFVPFSQPANINCADTRLSKTAHTPKNLSDSEVVAPLDLYFPQRNSLEYSNSFGKEFKVTAVVDFGDGSQEEEASFDIPNDGETLKTSQDENPQFIEALFLKGTQESPVIPSSKSNSCFANESPLDQLLTDSRNFNRISNIHNPYDVTEGHQMLRSQRCPAERELRGVVTAPEQIFSPNIYSLNAIDKAPIKNTLNDYCVQENERFSKQLENTTDLEHIEGFVKSKRNMNVAETMQNHSKKKRTGGWKELSLPHLQIFGRQEAEKETCSYYDQTPKSQRQKDEDSQLSSPTPSYSPKQTDSYSNSTSDECEEEDEAASWWYQNSFSSSYGNSSTISSGPWSLDNCPSTTDKSSFLLETTSRRNKASHSQSKPAKEDPVSLLQNTPLGPFQHKQDNSERKRNAWSQTEKYAEKTQRFDVAIQCGLIQACSCTKKELFSLHRAETVSSTSKTNTTGGQSIPTEEDAAFK